MLDILWHMKMQIMKSPTYTTTLLKILALTGMLLFITYYGYGQQALTISYEPDQKYEIMTQKNAVAIR